MNLLLGIMRKGNHFLILSWGGKGKGKKKLIADELIAGRRGVRELIAERSRGETNEVFILTEFRVST